MKRRRATVAANAVDADERAAVKRKSSAAPGPNQGPDSRINTKPLKSGLASVAEDKVAAEEPVGQITPDKAAGEEHVGGSAGQSATVAMGPNPTVDGGASRAGSDRFEEQDGTYSEEEWGGTSDYDGYDAALESQSMGYDTENEVASGTVEQVDSRTVQAKASLLDEKGRQAEQQARIDEVRELTGLSEQACLLLLKAYKWNLDEMVMRWYEDPTKACAYAGVSTKSAKVTTKVSDESFECPICREEGTMWTTALACEHAFCNTCWKTYIKNQVTNGVTVISCPAHKCEEKLSSEALEALADASTYAKYKEFLVNSFVDDNSQICWCPVPGCGLAVDISSGASKVATCQRGHTFCSSCKQENHQPASCEHVKDWLKKCDDDSETFNWISANTQDCPKCESTIEKNGGCNHMTCRKCRHEFCWVCLEPWSKHTDFYSCNRYDPNVSKESAKKESRAALDRYLFHYHRYLNHDNSRKLDDHTRRQAEKKMQELQNAKALPWVDVKFIEDATRQLIQCRFVLKWTYVLAFYLADDSKEKNLFCFLQQDLEITTERLSGLLQSDVEVLAENKDKVLNLSAVAARSRSKLLKGVEEGLASG